MTERNRPSSDHGDQTASHEPTPETARNRPLPTTQGEREAATATSREQVAERRAGTGATREGSAQHGPPGNQHSPRATQALSAERDPKTPVLQAHDVSRTYRTPAGDVHAVAGVSLELRPGELLVVRGPSGAGKSTLLGLIGTLDAPTGGRILIDGADVASLDEAALAALRRDHLGWVFQDFGLLDVLTAAENIEVPLRLQETDARERDERVRAALESVGLADHADQLPEELSGGQQQRVGIARALVANPRLLLADEPTGQLDSQNAQIVMDLIADLVHDRGVAAVVATHDPAFAARADRVLELRDGREVAQSRP